MALLGVLFPDKLQVFISQFGRAPVNAVVTVKPVPVQNADAGHLEIRYQNLLNILQPRSRVIQNNLIIRLQPAAVT